MKSRTRSRDFAFGGAHPAADERQRTALAPPIEKLVRECAETILEETAS